MAAQLLTRRKQAWVDRRRPDVIRGDALNNPSIVEARYLARLDALVDRMTTQVEKRLRDFFHEPTSTEYFAQDASIASQARILANALSRKFNDLFAAHAGQIATTSMNDADRASSTAMHSSLEKLSGGLSLPTSGITGDMTEVLKASISENVGLIRSISQQYLDGVNGAVMRSIASGNGLQDLVPYLQKHKGITKRRARMIAHDQTRKAYNNLNRGRMEKLGMRKFEWLHTGGSAHPRKLHQSYSGRIFSFDNPPIIDEATGERGIPGQAINCRCRMVPVIELGD